MTKNFGVKEVAVIGGAPKPRGRGQQSVFLFEPRLEVSSGPGFSNQRMHSNHWENLFKMLIPRPHPRGSYLQGMMQEPGICAFEGDVRLIVLQAPCWSHMEKQHKTRNRRTRVCLCCSLAFGSEFIFNTMYTDECGRV